MKYTKNTLETLPAIAALKTLTILSGFLLLSTLTAQAANNNEYEITFDDGTLFEHCMLDGGSNTDSKDTYIA
ncbi:MAG: hypothetical protein HRU28_01630 [Rhizobiales bacterium]|nr:hypothetical protein [Hyphomicrobiales bacterium]